MYGNMQTLGLILFYMQFSKEETKWHQTEKDSNQIFSEIEMMEEHILNRRYSIEEYILGDWGE